MECAADKRLIIPSLFFVLLILVSCIPAAPPAPPSLSWQPPSPTPTLIEIAQGSTLTPTDSPIAGPTPSIPSTATRCPIPTRVAFWVDPVTSPTDQTSQIITVHIGNGEWIKITTESGTFTATGTSSVEISLLPNTVHHLEVIAKVRKVVGWHGCVYGDYIMRTTRDKQGAPLTIVQRERVP